jgi:hypothetical protein
MMSAGRTGLAVMLGITLAACGGAPEPAATDQPPAAQPAASQGATAGGGTTTEIHAGQGGSPHVKSEWRIDDATVSITYGRPSLRGRTVGETVDPMPGQVWRVGADEATTLSSDRALNIGGTTVPAGDHTLWVLATGDTWQLIVNEETGQWGTAYDPSRDLARIPMNVTQAAAPTEQLTISIRDGQLAVEWGPTVATVPVSVAAQAP